MQINALGEYFDDLEEDWMQLKNVFLFCAPSWMFEVVSRFLKRINDE